MINSVNKNVDDDLEFPKIPFREKPHEWPRVTTFTRRCSNCYCIFTEREYIREIEPRMFNLYFGKYRGHTVEDVLLNDPQYLLYIYDTMKYKLLKEDPKMENVLSFCKMKIENKRAKTDDWYQYLDELYAIDKERERDLEFKKSTDEYLQRLTEKGLQPDPVKLKEYNEWCKTLQVDDRAREKESSDDTRFCNEYAKRREEKERKREEYLKRREEYERKRGEYQKSRQCS